MSDTKIKTSNIGNLAVTHALLHTDMDLTSKTVQVATPTSNTHPATKLYVDTEVSNLIDSAPGTLDTLNELAAAVNDDANFAASITTSLGTKVDKIDITGATVGTSTAIPVLTFNAQGQITSATTTTVAGIDDVTFTSGTLTISTGDGTDYTNDFDARYFTETEANNNFLGINAKAADADLFDGLDSTQFLRSDADDSTTGKLSVGSGAAGSMQLNVNGDIYVGDNSDTGFGMYSGGALNQGSDGSINIVGDANTSSPNTSSYVQIGFGNTAGVNYDQSTGAALDNLGLPAATTMAFYSNRMIAHKDLILNPRSTPTGGNNEGAMYYDSDDDVVKFYNGTSWIPLTGEINRYSYTATSNQTAFNATYSGSNVDVFLNGIKLVATTDFSASNGTSIVLTSGADAGDLVDIIAQTSSFSTYNSVEATGGTFTGDVDFNGTVNITGSNYLNVNQTVNTTFLRVTQTGDLSLGGTSHGFQIGPTSGANMAMDPNEIMARNNGAAAELHLNADGGNVTVNNQGALSAGSKFISRNKIWIGNDTNANTESTAMLHIHKDVNTGSSVTLAEAPSIVLSENEIAGAGAQGYHGAYWFGSQDTNTASDFNWYVAGMASQGGDTQGSSADGNLEFYTTNAGSSATKSATLTQTGRWSVPAQPAFEMIKTTDTTGTANSSNYIRYDTVQFETGGSGCSTSTGVYTAPEDGLYHFSITFTIAGGTGTGDDSIGVAFVIASNSTYYNQNYSANTGHRINPVYDTAGAGVEHTYSFQKTARLADNATIGFYITDWNDASTILQHAEFSGHKFA